jgi:hypothetical protein
MAVMTDARAVVFVGPTLYGAAAGDRPEIEFRPPVKRGDLDALVAYDRLSAIGLIDGVFFQSMAIPPKEVLRAIDRGIVVFGSSSMGALRAVECAPFGMVGIGRIYREFASGRLDADDEVALTYDIESLRPLSEPLINLRLAVAEAVSAGAITAQIAGRFLRAAKKLYFPQRSVPAVLAHLADEISAEDRGMISRYFAGSAPDAKRDDALALLDAIDECLRVPDR